MFSQQRGWKFLIKICELRISTVYVFSTCFLLIDFNRVTSRAPLFHLTINSTTIIRRLYYLIMLNGYQIWPWWPLVEKLSSSLLTHRHSRRRLYHRSGNPGIGEDTVRRLEFRVGEFSNRWRWRENARWKWAGKRRRMTRGHEKERRLRETRRKVIRREKERERETARKRDEMKTFIDWQATTAKAVNGYSNMRPCRGTYTLWLSNFIFRKFQPSEGFNFETRFIIYKWPSRENFSLDSTTRRGFCFWKLPPEKGRRSTTCDKPWLDFNST